MVILVPQASTRQLKQAAPTALLNVRSIAGSFATPIHCTSTTNCDHTATGIEGCEHSLSRLTSENLCADHYSQQFRPEHRHNARPLRSSHSLWNHPGREHLRDDTPRTQCLDQILTRQQMFGVTGAGMSKIKNMQNGGKRARRSIDQWDRVCVDRWTQVREHRS